MALSLTANQKIALDYYIAAYGRAPAQSGLDFFGEQLDSGAMNEEQIRDYMMNNEEAQNRYPNTGTAEEKVNTVFQNVLAREVASDAGMAFWTDKLAQDDYDMADLMADVLAIAKDPDNYVDADTLRSKAEVAEYYLETIPADQQQSLPYYLGNINFDNSTVTQGHQEIDGLVGAGLPVKLTSKIDDISENGHFTDKGTNDQAQIDATDALGVKTSAGNDTITGEKGTFQVGDKIIDSSTTDHDTLEVQLDASIGSAGNLGNAETGVTITNIEEITLRGEKTVTAYSLENVTSTANETNVVVNIDHNPSSTAGKFVSTTDVSVNGNAVVSNVDGNQIKEVNLIDNTRDMNFAEVKNNAVINLTNGEINSIGIDAVDDAKLASESITINMLNDKDGKLTLGLYDDNDDAVVAAKAVAAAALTTTTTDDAAAAILVADAAAEHDGGGFKEVTLVSSDVEMNVTLATGTHLNNNDSVHKDSNGAGAHENGGALQANTDGGHTLTPVSSVEAHERFALRDNLTPTTPDANPRTEDNLADTLNLEGSKDITITGTAGQLHQAVIKTEMTDDAKTHIAISGIQHTNVVDLTKAEVSMVHIDASSLGQNDMVITDADDTTDATQSLPAIAQIAIDDDTVAKITAIGDWGTLNITGDADKTDDLEIILNTGKDNANNGTLVLGGDDRSISETTTIAAGDNGDSAEAGAGSSAGSTQGGDANNATIHVEDDSTLNSLNISSLLGRLTIDGSGDLRVENGALLFDDSTVGFDDANTFAANNANSTNAEGEGAIIDGFGGDWVDATAMTGDFRVVLRDDQSKDATSAAGNDALDAAAAQATATLATISTLVATAVDADAADAADALAALNLYLFGTATATAPLVNDTDTTTALGTVDGAATDINEAIDDAKIVIDALTVLASEVTASQSESVDNNLNGIRMDFGSGDDMVMGLGSAAGGVFATRAGDNIDMGAGDDIVVIGVNDLATGTAGDATAAKAAFNGAIDTANTADNDTVVSAGDLAAEAEYGNQALMVHDRINAEVYLGEGEDTVIFSNQNSGFLAGNNGVRIKDFQTGNHGDEMGFDMFVNVSQRDLDLFNNGEVIADTDTGFNGKYIINGADAGNDTINTNTSTDTNTVATEDNTDDGSNNGNVVLISTADISKFNAHSADELWSSTPSSTTTVATVADKAVFTDVVNPDNQYETIVLVGESTGTDGVKIFYVTDDAAEGDATASLVGFLEGINIEDLHADNFDFM